MVHLEDLIERCHERYENPLRQRKTVQIPAMLRNGRPHLYTVFCARKYPVPLNELQKAKISFSAIGQAPQFDNGASGLREWFYTKRRGWRDTTDRLWETSWGIHIYTGTPSEHDNAKWHDLDFKYEAICAEPEMILTCIGTLVNAVENPLLTLTKSGGLRFSCRVTDYLHPDNEEERLFIYKYTPTQDNPRQRDIYLELYGDKGKNRWDARYEILSGNLLDPPIIPKEILFAPLDALRMKLYDPVPRNILQEQVETDSTLSLESHKLNLAKDALLKRGFHYLRKENNIHYSTRHGGDVNNTDIKLWENQDTVWISTSTPNAGIPMDATPITDVWSDTHIVPLELTATTPISSKTLAVRAGKLSPLAIVKKPSCIKNLRDMT